MLFCQALGRCTHLADVVMTCRAVHQQQCPSGGIWWVVGVWQCDSQIWLQLRRQHIAKHWTPWLRFYGSTSWSSTDTKTQPMQKSCMRQGLLLQRPCWFFPHWPYWPIGGPKVPFFSIDSIHLSCAGSRLTCQLFLWPAVQSPVQEKIEYNGDRSRSKRSE